MTRVGNAINAGAARRRITVKAITRQPPVAFLACRLTAKLCACPSRDRVRLGGQQFWLRAVRIASPTAPMSWRAHGGIAAHNGVLATLLAPVWAHRAHAPRWMPPWVCTAFTDGTDCAEAFTRDLGELSHCLNGIKRITRRTLGPPPRCPHIADATWLSGYRRGRNDCHLSTDLDGYQDIQRVPPMRR